jgi:phospholipid transport system substrate-binding protein
MEEISMRKIGLYLSLIMYFVVAHAMASGPRELVEQTTAELLEEFTANRPVYEASTQKLYDLVDQVAIPHFSFQRMSELVLGRHWNGATPAQREQFQEAFKTLLVRTYATALFQYSGEKIAYQPAMEVNGDMVVRAEIDIGTATPVKLDYYLGTLDNAWKVFDVRIDGISLVTNYRKSYDVIIRSKGLPALITALQDKNRAQSTQ